MCKTLQLFTNVFKLNTNIFTNIKFIQTTCTGTKVIKGAKRIKAWIKLKLFIVPGLVK